MEYRHYTGFNKNSNFEKLSGDIQRAILTQVNIELEARKLSKYFQKSFKDESIQEEFFNMTCDQYSNKDEKELKKLVIMESKSLYFHPLTEDRFKYYEMQAELRAKQLDNNIKIRMSDHFKTRE